MVSTKKEQDFSKQIYGVSIEEIVDEYSEVLSQYRAHIVRELGKSLKNELKDVPPAYVEYFFFLTEKF